MKPARWRHVLLFLAAMFLASNTAAAVRACIVDLAGPEHGAIRLADAGGGEHQCPVSGDASRCLTHCTQSYKNDEQKFWTDVPGIVVAPAPAYFFVSSYPEAAVSALGSAPPVGPPLTILFRNLRF